MMHSSIIHQDKMNTAYLVMFRSFSLDDFLAYFYHVAYAFFRQLHVPVSINIHISHWLWSL